MKSQEYPCSSCSTHCEGKLHFSFLLMSCTSKPQSPRHMNRRNLEFPFHPVLIAGANSGVPWIGRPPVFLENKFHWTSTPLLIVSPVHILAWRMWLLIKDLQMIMPSILHCTAAPQLKALEACGLGKYMGQASEKGWLSLTRWPHPSPALISCQFRLGDYRHMHKPELQKSWISAIYFKIHENPEAHISEETKLVVVSCNRSSNIALVFKLATNSTSEFPKLWI